MSYWSFNPACFCTPTPYSPADPEPRPFTAARNASWIADPADSPDPNGFGFGACGCDSGSRNFASCGGSCRCCCGGACCCGCCACAVCCGGACCACGRGCCA